MGQRGDVGAPRLVRTGANVMTTSEIITVGVNGLLVLITGLYAIFTFRILKANQQVATEMALQRRNLLRPIISIRPYISERVVLSLLIINSGASPASNLRLTLNKDFYRFAESNEDANIKNFHAFNEVIPTFAAGSELHIVLSQGFNLAKTLDGKMLTPMEFNIRAQYDYLGDHFDEEFRFDLRHYMKTSGLRHWWEDEVVKIREALEKLSNKS
jgi:hypothetical protein